MVSTYRQKSTEFKNNLISNAKKIEVNKCFKLKSQIVAHMSLSAYFSCVNRHEIGFFVSFYRYINSLKGWFFHPLVSTTEKNGFVPATKLGTTNKFFAAATKNFAAPTKCFVDRTKHFVVVTKYFCYPYFNK